MEIDFVCLANSWREGGKCVAGIRLDGKGWIRPVNSPEGGALQQRYYTLYAGRPIALLDHVRVAATRPCPLPYHPENWLLEEGKSWKLIDTLNVQKARQVLTPYLTGGPTLFGNDAPWRNSSEFQDNPSEASLLLVSPQGLQWSVWNSWGKRKCRAQFHLGGAHYDLPLTDPEWNIRILKLEDGSYTTKQVAGSDATVALTVSLGAPFALQNNRCYKIVQASSYFNATSRPSQ